MKGLIKTLKTNWIDLGIITFVFLLATFILYGYFAWFSGGGMDTVFRNWDGPGYRIVAETLYNVQKLKDVNPYPFLPPTHFSYEFPLYPLFIRLFSFMGFDVSMIFTSCLFSLLFIYSCYFLIKKTNPAANPLAVSLLLIFYTPRWFIISHTGSAEPLLLFCITMMLLTFAQKRYVLSAVFGALIQLTKSQGIIIFTGISVYMIFQLFIERKKIINTLTWYIPFLLIPLALIGVFSIYYVQYGNFFQYFNIREFNVTQFPPFKLFFIYAGDFELWKEAPLFDYLIFFIPVFILLHKKLYFYAIVALIYFLPTLCLVHPDIGRYIVPLLPFAALAYSDAFSKKYIYTPMLYLTPLVYFFAVSFILTNAAP